MTVVKRFHAEARRIREFLGRVLSSAKVSDLGLKLIGWLRRFDEQGGMIVQLKFSLIGFDLLCQE